MLIDDGEGMAAGLIARAGGRPDEVRAGVTRGLDKLAKVSGGGGQLYMHQATAKAFDQAETLAEKAGDAFVTVERMLQALAMDRDSEAGKILSQGRCDAAEPEHRDQRAAQGPHRRQRLGRAGL